MLCFLTFIFYSQNKVVEGSFHLALQRHCTTQGLEGDSRLVYAGNKVQILTVVVTRQLCGAFEDSLSRNIFRSGLQVGFSCRFGQVDADVPSIGAYMRRGSRCSQWGVHL